MKRKLAQLEMFNWDSKKFFGGSIRKSHPKTARPLCSKRGLHLVMHSEYAVGANSFQAKGNIKVVPQIIRRQAKRFGIRIYDLVINGNHFHGLIRISKQRLYKAFIRAISGLIARHVMKTERGLAKLRDDLIDDSNHANRPIKTPGKTLKKAYRKPRFWNGRPFTRIVEWGRDYLQTKKYILKNRLEAIGFAVEVKTIAKRQIENLPLLARFRPRQI